MRRFIYCPRSGSRVFAEMATPTVTIETLGNNSKVSSGGVTLRFTTSIPKAHWRTAGRLMAARLIDEVGGIAWDEQGTLFMVVPLHAAENILDSMIRVQNIVLLSGTNPDTAWNRDSILVETLLTEHASRQAAKAAILAPDEDIAEDVPAFLQADLDALREMTYSPCRAPAVMD